MEDVRSWGVVNDDSILEVSADLRQILHVVSLVVIAAFAEESVMDDLVNVKLIQ